MNSSSIRATLRGAAVLCAALAAGGCYEAQAVRGQLALMSERVPIERVIASPQTPQALRAQLLQVRAIREFASRELGLPDNGSYRSYADIGRAFVVWNVVAAPEFSVEPRQWCYPVAGCVAYRGYFSEQRARSYARSLHAGGMDVSVAGVAAYSTLGHFDDPVISTMMSWSDVQLASILFHELSHQLLYVAGDSSFDEAFASVVEEEGLRRWLGAQGRDQDLREYGLQQDRYRQAVALLIGCRAELAALYASGADASLLRRRKRETFDALRAAYARLKTGWGGYAGFDPWFGADLSNGSLAAVATYEDCVPGFQRELAAGGGDLRTFYAAVRRLAKLPQRERDARVCGGPQPG
jgi:predicted aminopeptidase